MSDAGAGQRWVSPKRPDSSWSEPEEEGWEFRTRASVYHVPSAAGSIPRDRGEEMLPTKASAAHPTGTGVADRSWGW